VKGCRQREIVPHVARKEKIKTPDLDGRTIGSTAYRVSQIIRKRVEEIIGWIKVIGGLRRSRYREPNAPKPAATLWRPLTTCCAWRGWNWPGQVKAGRPDR